MIFTLMSLQRYANKTPVASNGEGPPASAGNATVGIGGSRISKNAASKIFPSKSDSGDEYC